MSNKVGKRMGWLQDHFRTTRDAHDPQRAMDRYRMGKRAGGSIRGVRILADEDSCASCFAVAGIVYPIDEAPALPIENCTCSAGCRCVYRPVMSYEPEDEYLQSPPASSDSGETPVP